ncbi:hypothetical protein HK102_002955 [Quaeritorhiza haematococci]|nr:hypothetical protein HK102_002955 [Quaeritorhiza haematococci]
MEIRNVDSTETLVGRMNEQWNAKPVDLSQVDKAAECLVRAFANDPVKGYIFANRTPEKSTKINHAMFAALLRLVIKGNGIVLQSHDYACVSIWLTPDFKFLPKHVISSGFPKMPFVHGFKPMLRWIETGHTYFKNKSKHFRSEKSYYLAYVGTNPDHQGKGYLKNVIRPVLEQANREGARCWLESSNEANVSKYGRFGFKTVETSYYQQGTERIPSIVMIREPETK